MLAYTILGAEKMDKFEKMRIWLGRKIDKIGDGSCMGAQEDIGYLQYFLDSHASYFLLDNLLFCDFLLFLFFYDFNKTCITGNYNRLQICLLWFTLRFQSMYRSINFVSPLFVLLFVTYQVLYDFGWARVITYKQVYE